MGEKEKTGEVKYCIGCAHRRPISSFGGVTVCNYALDTGHCRLVPVERCPYKTTETEADMNKADFDEVEARRLHKEGKSDYESAAALGIARGTYSRWRRREGLPTMHPKTKKAKENREMGVKAPADNALSEGLREKVKDKLRRDGVIKDLKPETGLAVEDPAAAAAAAYRTKSDHFVDVNKMITGTATPNEYDPLIFEAFDISVRLLHDAGVQPQFLWRALLHEAETQIDALDAYIRLSDETCRRAVELAAHVAANKAREGC